MKKHALAQGIALATSLIATTAFAGTLEEIYVIGSKEQARKVAGSGAVVDTEQFKIENITDINQALKTLPGIYIREEDGSGLRPNIGIRGATSERSEKITLMEDGVLIAPAPYSNPAAYYFPTAMRQTAIEVLKGAPLLRHGPQTTGGVVNLISTPIPETTGGKIAYSTAENNSHDLLANYGGQNGQFGWLIETTQRQSDGFKDIDRSGSDTGYDIEDYMVKLGWTGETQSLLFKAQRSEETSNETYLGLTDADFDRDENRRYGLSDIDEMNNDHDSITLTYTADLADNVKLTAIAYNNEFSRDWFKLSGGGSLVENANNGDANAQGILDGTIDEAGLSYKHNNRSYESKGLDINFDIELNNHKLALGIRDHQDEMDRFQPVETFNQVNGELVYQSTSTDISGSNNRQEEADALSLWLVDNWQVNEKLKVTLAARYEDVESSRKQFSTSDRSGSVSIRGNDNSEWLPGASFTYNISDDVQVLAGVHKGFSPLGGGAQDYEKPESSTNWEFGARYNKDDFFVEAIGFYSDFSNKAENCSVGNACSNGDTSGSFVTGEAVIQGLELQASAIINKSSFVIPVDATYTYTSAETSKDNPTTDRIKGETLKDIPENVLSLRVGLEHTNGWNNYAVAKYIDDMCVRLGCNFSGDPLEKTDSLLVVDYISRYTMNDDVQLFFKVENLLDNQKIVSRTPDGARPNKPRTASLGVSYAF